MIEHLYAMLVILNGKGKSSFYGEVGGALITGNDVGIKHCAMSMLYSIGYFRCTRFPATTRLDGNRLALP